MDQENIVNRIELLTIDSKILDELIYLILKRCIKRRMRMDIYGHAP